MNSVITGQIAGHITGQGTYSARSLHGRVVHEIGIAIVSGKIAEGETLPNEKDLGLQLSVSRTALREGIKVLAAKGLLESRTRTGTTVRPRAQWNMLDPDILAWSVASGPSEELMRDLFEFRLTIEPMAAALAAERAGPGEIARIENALNDMIAAGDDIEAGIEPDLRFHKSILGASGNELLAPLGALVETALGQSFRLSRTKGDFDPISLHRAVLDGIKSHDPDAARGAMLYLLGRSRRSVDKAVLGISGRGG